MKIDKVVLLKGRTWGTPNIDALPEIDFDKIEKETNLSFNKEIREEIKYALAEYTSQIKNWLDIPSSKRRQSSLRAVEKACSLLESFLEWDAPGVLEDNEYDSTKKFLYDHVIPNVNCLIVGEGKGLPRMIVKERELFDLSERGQIVFKGKNVADYLALCRKRIREVKNWPSKPGPRKDFAIRRCLIWLYDFYLLGGGERPGARRELDETYSGAFLTFAKELLDKVGAPYSKPAIYEILIKNGII